MSTQVKELEMPVTVLIEGLDLTGKTTLARTLVAELARSGVPVMHHRGFLARRHPLAWLLEHSAPGDRPDSQALNAAFLCGAALDRLIAGRPCRGPGVLVQESYVDRAVAYGTAAGRWPLAMAAARHPRVFASFDMAVITHAPPSTRLERLTARGDGDAVDRLTLTDQAFTDTFYEALAHVAGRHRRVLRVDTSLRRPQDIARQLAGELVPALAAHGGWQ
jgi:thymidylate kinase